MEYVKCSCSMKTNFWWTTPCWNDIENNLNWTCRETLHGGLPSLWIVALDDPSSEFLVETSRDTDWTGLGLLSSWTEVCRVYWAIILSHCDHDIWHTDLKIHRVDGRDTAYIPAKFHRNSFKNKRAISVQHIFQGCLLVTLTFDLRPWNLHQIVSLSTTIDQLNLKTMGW